MDLHRAENIEKGEVAANEQSNVGVFAPSTVGITGIHTPSSTTHSAQENSSPQELLPPLVPAAQVVLLNDDEHIPSTQEANNSESIIVTSQPAQVVVMDEELVRNTPQDSTDNNSTTDTPVPHDASTSTESELRDSCSPSTGVPQEQDNVNTALQSLPEQLEEQICHSESLAATPMTAVAMAQAVHVTIDDEILQHTPRPYQSPYTTEDGNQPHYTLNPNHPQPHQNKPHEKSGNNNNNSNNDNNHHKRRPRLYWVCAALLVILVGISIAIAIPLINKNNEASSDDAAPVYDYPCFTSTLELLLAQLEDMDNKTAEATYILCPNTIIEVGVMENPAANQFYFKNGDYPLWVVNSNTIVQCGLDGSSKNNCVLSGGFVQVLLQADIPLPPAYHDKFGNDDEDHDLMRSLDNVTIRGVTFTGVILNSGPFTGASVILSQSGSIVLEDCHWEDLTSSHGVILVGYNTYLLIREIPLRDTSTHLTIRQSSFSNIVFDAPLISVHYQNLTLEQSEFTNIQASPLARPFCTFTFVDGTSFSTEDGCAGLLYCSGNASCVMQDCCVRNYRKTGPAMVFFAHNNTTGMLSRNYLEQESACNWAIGQESLVRNGGLQPFECADGFVAPTCSLPLP